MSTNFSDVSVQELTSVDGGSPTKWLEAAFSVGVAIGTFIDQQTGLSDIIADTVYDWTHPDD